MSKKLTVIPEQCSGRRICELVCAIKHFGVNNPKKAAIRVLTTYPHPVVRMPIVCIQRSFQTSLWGIIYLGLLRSVISSITFTFMAASSGRGSPVV
jgi:hypothetical protein